MFSRSVDSGDRLSASRRAKGERGIWQRRYWEHTIRNDNDFERHCHYFNYNPVKHGNVVAARQWPFSSFHRFVKLGVYPIDWAEGYQIEGDKFGER